jgi:hypothetical protein
MLNGNPRSQFSIRHASFSISILAALSAEMLNADWKSEIPIQHSSGVIQHSAFNIQHFF